MMNSIGSCPRFSLPPRKTSPLCRLTWHGSGALVRRPNQMGQQGDWRSVQVGTHTCTGIAHTHTPIYIYIYNMILFVNVCMYIYICVCVSMILHMLVHLQTRSHQIPSKDPGACAHPNMPETLRRSLKKMSMLLG